MSGALPTRVRGGFVLCNDAGDAVHSAAPLTHTVKMLVVLMHKMLSLRQKTLSSNALMPYPEQTS